MQLLSFKTQFTCLCLLFVSTLFSQDSTTKQTDTNTCNLGKINALISIAEKQIGIPYHYGGTTPSGFDCSGFVQYCFKNALQINLPHQSNSISQMGVPVSKLQAKPGDIIYFTSRRSNGQTGHIGIVIECTNTNVYFIHASTSKGVRIDSLTDGYYAQRYLGIKRLF